MKIDLKIYKKVLNIFYYVGMELDTYVFLNTIIKQDSISFINNSIGESLK